MVAFFLLPVERFGRLSLLGLLLGFCGVVVLVLPSLAGGPVGTWPGPLFVIAAFLSTAVGTVVLRRVGGGRQGLWQIGVQFGVGGLLLGGVALILPSPEVLPLTAGVLYSLGALVAFSSVIGYFVYFTLHHRVGPVRANVVAYLLPLVGIGVGSGLLGEPVSLWEVAGSLVVVGGVTLILRESIRRRAVVSAQHYRCGARRYPGEPPRLAPRPSPLPRGSGTSSVGDEGGVHAAGGDLFLPSEQDHHDDTEEHRQRHPLRAGHTLRWTGDPGASTPPAVGVKAIDCWAAVPFTRIDPPLGTPCPRSKHPP